MMAEIKLEKRPQLARLTIAETLIGSVWDEVRAGRVDEEIGQTVVNIQVDVNRIVWKLNQMLNPKEAADAGRDN